MKYLGINIDSNLNWKEHMNAIVIKLNRANSILSKLRYFVQSSTLKSIYHAIFESHFNYASIVWAQGVNFQNSNWKIAIANWKIAIAKKSNKINEFL